MLQDWISPIFYLNGISTVVFLFLNDNDSNPLPHGCDNNQLSTVLLAPVISSNGWNLQTRKKPQVRGSFEEDTEQETELSTMKQNEDRVNVSLLTDQLIKTPVAK